MRYLSTMLVFAAVGCLLGTYVVERKVVRVQNELSEKRRQISENRHTLHLLQAEWAMLTSPEHLSKITTDKGLAPMEGKQLMTADRLMTTAPLVMDEPQDIPLSDMLHDR